MQINIESDELMGPGWLMFFTGSRVYHYAGAPPDKTEEELHLKELGLEEDDIIEIIEITLMTGVL